MTTNIKEFEKSIELLLKDVSEFKQQVQSVNECEEIMDNNQKRSKAIKATNQTTQIQHKFIPKQIPDRNTKTVKTTQKRIL